MECRRSRVRVRAVQQSKQYIAGRLSFGARAGAGAGLRSLVSDYKQYNYTSISQCLYGAEPPADVPHLIRDTELSAQTSAQPRYKRNNTTNQNTVISVINPSYNKIKQPKLSS